MGRFSISDLEQLSGIRAHTIRMWEQRYGILRPVRTATNIRTYCDDDLRRLLNVATLCGRGKRISQVARLSDEELAQAVLACCDASRDYERQVNALLAAMLEMDELVLDELLRNAIRQLGFEKAIMHVAYPFLQRVGVLWQTGTVNPAQEHLVTNLLRQKIMAATDALAPVHPAKARRWVLFLPEGEMHELALLFMNYALRVRGHHVLYLGQNLPIAELESVCASYTPYALCTVLTAVPERDRVPDYIQKLAAISPETLLVLYGPLAQQLCLDMPENIIKPPLMTDFLALADKTKIVSADQLQPEHASSH
ncbi:MerR family transcriptional regulator [Hymenobacter sp. GOD-10R]|uniref:MerR family transcriptional regulator n=1 Tax=Hymenobacter sp. GOD-10R TaxID=3093922 RepID=UPI002D7A049B|nr:MerR family transcriptional regulator [Hymenobacter sp. GOD-10R]WRQ27201.1 MerR family transcriptional regulator [Hymenobacter sp. GOD-10R]